MVDVPLHRGKTNGKLTMIETYEYLSKVLKMVSIIQFSHWYKILPFKMAQRNLKGTTSI